MALWALSLLILAPCAFTNYVVSRSNDAQPTDISSPERTFRVDHVNNIFRKDGQPFRFVGGSFHYFRALPGTWQHKLRTMRAAGLNVVTTYVEWSLHNPQDGVYAWEGIADLQRFIELAALEDLLVILRPGPYICAERDLGGFPYWLLTKYPNIKLRTMDRNYLHEVQRWYDELMPRVEQQLYENGGPIIMVQVENEYGSYKCDALFRQWMRIETERHVRGKAALFTNDGPSQTRCGKIPGVLATLDFGSGSSSQIDGYWATLRKSEPTGPLVNSEYYPGWLTHWQEPMSRVQIDPVVNSLRHMLQQNASVNFYMFFGGTNFGFTAGANTRYVADLTSYDYDAPMDEAGDPTDKYFAIRTAIGEFLPLPDNIPLPSRQPKMRLEQPVLLSPVARLLSMRGRKHLGTKVHASLHANVTFEALDQYSGFVLYETQLPRRFKADPSVLRIHRLHDRATVMVDQHFIGTMSRENRVHDLPIAAQQGQTLQVLVENQGRINYGIMEDFKGILGNVTLNGQELTHWTITGYPFARYEHIEALIADVGELSEPEAAGQNVLLGGPAVYHGAFELDGDKPIYDTYLDPTGWGKGLAFVNGFNLGRYWPVVGPQVTLYVPKDVLRAGTNRLTLVELQRSNVAGAVSFTDVPKLDEF